MKCYCNRPIGISCEAECDGFCSPLEEEPADAQEVRREKRERHRTALSAAQNWTVKPMKIRVMGLNENYRFTYWNWVDTIVNNKGTCAVCINADGKICVIEISKLKVVDHNYIPRRFLE